MYISILLNKEFFFFVVTYPLDLTKTRLQIQGEMEFPQNKVKLRIVFHQYANNNLIISIRESKEKPENLKHRRR